MFHILLRLFSRWYGFQEVSLSKEMQTLWGSEVRASVKWAEPDPMGCPKPEDVKLRMQAAEDAAETLWLIEQREKERAAMEARQPNVIPYRARSVK